MNPLFEPMKLEGKPVMWNGRQRTEADFSGYYHWHQCAEMLLVHEGRGSVVVGRHAYEIRRGMLFFFPPFQLHHVFAHVSPECPYIRSVFHFDHELMGDSLSGFPARRGLLDSMCRGQREEYAFDLGDRIGYAEEVCRIYGRAAASGHGESYEEASLLLLQLLNAIVSVLGARREAGAARTDADGPQRPFRYAESVMRWIEAHYAEEFRLDKLADGLHLSKFYVSRIFREETGSSITDYLTARRIKQACRLLQTTSLPVERIGGEVGLPNPSYFVRLFKRHVGTTPLKYRYEVRARL